ncbi:MAG: BamA/TamA family outer membrane protein [Vicinamibacterales bacterium]
MPEAMLLAQLVFSAWLSAGATPAANVVQAPAPPETRADDSARRRATNTRADAPRSRGEESFLLRAEKAERLKPYVPGKVERALLIFERERVIERLLSPTRGFFPKVGHVTPGSSLSFGAGYRDQLPLGRKVEVSAFILGSPKGYWRMDAQLALRELAGGLASLDLYGQRYEWSQESFYGVGPGSAKSAHSNYRLHNTIAGAKLGLRVSPTLTFGGRVERMLPRVGRGGSNRLPTVRTLFEPAVLPELESRLDFNRYEVGADLDYREPRGNPKSGGRYRVGYSFFHSGGESMFDFRRLHMDLQQYLPFLQGKRVIALRALVSLSDPGTGGDVPFYLMPTLGGPDDLRGYRRHRFRDRNLALLQAEYRWEILAALDAALFVEAGQVASRARDFRVDRFETDYGIGLRFGTVQGVFLRIEGAFGSSDGSRLIVSLGNVF